MKTKNSITTAGHYRNRPTPFVSVVIPSHNRRKKLERLLESLQKSTYQKKSLEIIVVDDASDEDYSNIIEKFPNIIIIRNREEKLPAEARNIGARCCSGKYIFFVDDDNVADENCIKTIVEFMETNSRIGMVGPITYFYGAPTRIYCAGVRRNRLTSITIHIGRDEIDIGQYREPIPSEYIPNAFIIRKTLFNEVGGFDSRHFPIHFEETDLASKVWKAGYGIFVIPQARMWHDTFICDRHGGHAFSSERRAYFTARNRLIFHTRNDTVAQLLSFLAMLPLMVLYDLVGMSNLELGRRQRVVRAYLKGLWYGFLMCRHDHQRM